MHDARTHRILVLEDEWLIADDLASDLEERGYQVVGPVSSVAAALGLVEREKISAAILDINLGGEKCFPLATVLARQGIPFVFVSGHSASALPPEFSDGPLA